jgi:hypothetical protein
MTTANATTNEVGNTSIGGAQSYGKTLTRNEMYADRAQQSSIKWNYSCTEIMTLLRFRGCTASCKGAICLYSNYQSHTTSNCDVYYSSGTGHTAVHCPAVNRVVIIDRKGGYVIRRDKSFTGTKNNSRG